MGQHFGQLFGFLPAGAGGLGDPAHLHPGDDLHDPGAKFPWGGNAFGGFKHQPFAEQPPQHAVQIVLLQHVRKGAGGQGGAAVIHRLGQLSGEGIKKGGGQGVYVAGRADLEIPGQRDGAAQFRRRKPGGDGQLRAAVQLAAQQDALHIEQTHRVRQVGSFLPPGAAAAHQQHIGGLDIQQKSALAAQQFVRTGDGIEGVQDLQQMAPVRGLVGIPQIGLQRDAAEIFRCEDIGHPVFAVIQLYVGDEVVQIAAPLQVVQGMHNAAQAAGPCLTHLPGQFQRAVRGAGDRHGRKQRVHILAAAAHTARIKLFQRTLDTAFGLRQAGHPVHQGGAARPQQRVDPERRRLPAVAAQFKDRLRSQRVPVFQQG